MQQILLARPEVLGRQTFFRRFVEKLAATDAVRALQSWNARLRPHRKVSLIDVLPDLIDGLADVATVRMPVHHHTHAALAAEQVVHRRVKRFALDVPQRHIDGGDGTHRHRTTTPVRAAIQVLPDVFRSRWIATDEARNDVIRKIAGDREFAPVQRCVAESIDAFVRVDLERDKVSSRRADQDFGVFNLHLIFFVIPNGVRNPYWPHAFRVE